MRSIILLFIVLFFGILGRAQNFPLDKVKIVETAPFSKSNFKADITLFDNAESKQELSLIYRRRLSVVKKHLFFHGRKNKVKMA
ncbi:hypothetical protein ACEZ3G_00455 [Maribacter algicola]|uniref:Uncharacterized protein n=1 Tax=Meishania litoralis TaxID=3434685 RepID=A0ACC7LF40_9FLAO